MTEPLPIRHSAHKLETLSRLYVESIFCEWICQPVEPDYGLDLRVEIVAGEQVTGREFSVQLKATNHLKTSHGDVIHRCEVSTAGYFLRRSEPVMYVVYDAQQDTAYWLWMQPYLQELDEAKPGWRKQKTVQVRVPGANRLTPESIPAIVEYVQAWGAGPTVPFPSPPAYRDEDLHTYLQAVIDACAYIHLPATPGSDRPAVRLERVYVALKADRSSRAERRASHEFFHSMVDERLALQGGDLWRTVREVARLNPHAARFLRYNPIFAPLFAQETGEDEEPHYLAEIVRRHRWVVLLGDPGSGKTTLARWLALQMALALEEGRASLVEVRADHVRPDADREQVERLGVARLPVLVRVAHYAAARWPRDTGGQDSRLSLLAYVCSGRHVDGWLGPGHRVAAWQAVIEKHVAEGRALFILDGLDEVTDTAHRREIAAQIVQLIETHVRDAHGCTPLDPGDYADRTPVPGDEPARGGGGQLIVTSRIVGYQVHPLPAELPHFVIQPMDDTAVRRFCQAWAAASGRSEEAKPLQEAVLDHPNARVRDEMARNPLLLTVLAQVFETSPGGRLPHRRAELYEQAAQAVFDQRREQWERLAADLESRDFVRIMTRLTAHVALQLHANPDYPASLAEEESVRDWLAEAVAQEQALLKARRVDDVVADILEAARELSGFFIARGQGVYGFVHRQFQEYFAAKALMDGPDAQTAFLERLDDPVWREVLLLGVALSGRRRAQALLQAALEAPDPTGGLLPHNVLFVAAALRELERPPARLVGHVAARLIRAYRRDDEGRFATLHERVKRAFAALPRSVGRSDPVGDALCAALQTSKVLGELVRTTSEVSRLTRLAAAELVIECEWHTPAVAQALAQAWQAHLEPAGTLLAALASAHAAHPEHFSRRFLHFRRAVEKEPGLWDAVRAHAHWTAVVHALYLAPWADLETEAIVRDSALTEGLLPLLQEQPEDEAELRGFLTACFEGEATRVKQRDAGLALAYLGDTAIVPALVESRVEDRARQRATLAAMSWARARDLARDRVLDLDRARDRDRALDLDLARDRDHDHDRALDIALDIDLDRALDLDIDRDRDRDRDLFRKTIAWIDVAQTQAVAQGAPTEVHQALSSALETAKRLETFWVHAAGGFTAWVALGEAREAQSRSLADWAAAGRPALDAAWLAALNAALKARAGESMEEIDWPDLLPRLDSTPLARLQGEAAQTARMHLARWLTSFEGKAAPIARHGALLLAEMGHVTSQTVPLLCACLRDGQDLTRYRAQAALNRQRSASKLGRETIEQMARCYHCAGDAAALADCPVAQAGAGCWRGLDGTSAVWETAEAWLADTYLDWSLNEIEHDRPDWLHAWADANNTGILGQIHRLDNASWPVFLELLAEAAPPVREALLDSASWLLRPGRVPKTHLEALTTRLLASLGSDERDVQQAAVDALGHLPQPTEPVLARLQALRVSQTLRVYTALARLAGRAGDADRAAIETTLRAALPLEEAAGAQVRLRVTQAGKDFDPAVVLPTLSQDISDPDDLLAALLRAGTDDDGWGGFHERIVARVRELIKKRDGVPLGNLLTALGTALDGDEWPPKRIALAAVAACAEVMPETLNNALPRVDLEAMLIESARVADSFTARRQAVNTLSHLHTATPAAMAALLAASRDVAIVQQDAVAAAGRFQHLASDFAEADALDPLVMALHGESAAGAYVATRLLAALGSAPAAIEVPQLRQRISGILSAALRQEGARREVYLLLSGDGIEHKGTLAQALFDALVQVVGLPE